MSSSRREYALALLRQGIAQSQQPTDTEVAHEVGVCCSLVSRWRRQAKIPARIRPREEYQRNFAANPHLPRGGLAYSLAIHNHALSHGWPAEYRLNVLAVRVIECLCDYGPQTRKEVAQRLGLRWHPAVFSTSRILPGRSAFAALIYYGLAHKLTRSQPTGKQGLGRLPDLYFPAVSALELRSAHLQQQQQQRASS